MAGVFSVDQFSNVFYVFSGGRVEKRSLALEDSLVVAFWWLLPPYQQHVLCATTRNCN